MVRENLPKPYDRQEIIQGVVDKGEFFESEEIDAQSLIRGNTG